MKSTFLLSTFACLAWAAPSLAQDTASKVATFMFNGQRMTISQTDRVNPLKVAKFTEASGGCASPCLAPMSAARGVMTVGEAEVLEFLQSEVQSGTGLLVDARLPDLRQTGFIPASVNVPLAAISDDNPYRSQILSALGGVTTGVGWDFSRAYDLTIFDSGTGSSEASSLLRELVSVGYPESKLYFYRGGMQIWAGLGLSFVEPQS